MSPAYDGWPALVFLAPYLSRDCHGCCSAPPVHRQIAPDLYGVRGRQAPVPIRYEILVMVQSHNIRYRARPGDEICYYPLSPCGHLACVIGNS